MGEVDPIKDLKKIEAMKRYLKNRDIKSHAMFVVGINVALRITDLLSLKWSDVLTEKKKFKNIKILEGTIQRERIIKLNKNSKKALQDYLHTIEAFSFDDYIFKSKKGINKQISRQWALKILKESAREVGVKENIGTHSLRKIWGYWAWKKGIKPVQIMEVLNYSNWSITKRYIGITEDEINDSYKKSKNDLYKNLNI